MSRVRLLGDEDLRGSILAGARRFQPQIDFVAAVHLGLAGAADSEVLDFARANGRIVVSHDVNTMGFVAAERVATGQGISGLFLAPQRYGARCIVESLILIWSASEMEEWHDPILYLPL